MEDQEEPTTPFWAKSSSHRRPAQSRFLNSGVLLFTLCIMLSFFLYFIFPSLVSFRPSLLFKNSWESLNVTLVLLAIIFGFLSRNINHDRNDRDSIRNEGVHVKSSGSTPRGWYEYSDRMPVVSLKRSYSSYPDLREIEYTVDSWQFYDDTSLARAPRGSPVEKTGTRDVVDRWRFDDDMPSKQVPLVRPVVNTGSVLDKPMGDGLGSESWLSESRRFVAEENVDRKTNQRCESDLPKERIIEQVYKERVTPSMPAVRHVLQRTAETGPYKENVTDDLSGSEHMARRTDEKKELSEKTTYNYEESTRSRIERKRGGNATKHFIDSFRKKKKKQRQKSVENFEALIGSCHPPAPPPPPPPPRNLFSSKKNKKIITLPPPPPPPPPYFITKAQKSVVTVAPTTILHTQRLPVQNSASGESPLRPIPPPPPPPPFKMRSWKFEVKGDYVRIGSLSSDEVDDSPRSSESGESPTEPATRAMFCPSPDVNSKADMFIAKFRAGLKLQKLNSMNLKQGLGMSNLGPKTN